MKTKFLFSVLALTFCVGSVTMAQDKAKAKNEKSITWYGIDFTVAKFTLVTDDPTIIVNNYLKSINMLIQMEPAKFDLKKWFNKTEVAYELDQVNQRNAKINPAELVIGDGYKITLDDVKGVLAKYDTKGKTGMGSIWVAENLHKVSQMGSFYVVFFDQVTKEIIDAQRFEGKAVGIGFRNYWAGSIYNIMKIWLKE
jgi:hypothetical protein